MVHKVSFHLASVILSKDRLTIVRVSAEDINRPCRPEVHTVLYAIEASGWQYLKKGGITQAHKAGAEAVSGAGATAALGSFEPEIGGAVEQFVRDINGAPFGNLDARLTIELCSNRLIKEEIRSLRIVEELDDVKVPVAGTDEDRLGSAAQLSNAEYGLNLLFAVHLFPLSEQRKTRR